jgi:hypothetical protein
MPVLRVTMSELEALDCIRLGKGDTEDSLPRRLNPSLDVGLEVFVSPGPNSDWRSPLVLEFFSEAKCQKRVFSDKESIYVGKLTIWSKKFQMCA